MKNLYIKTINDTILIKCVSCGKPAGIGQGWLCSQCFSRAQKKQQKELREKKKKKINIGSWKQLRNKCSCCNKKFTSTHLEHSDIGPVCWECIINTKNKLSLCHNCGSWKSVIEDHRCRHALKNIIIN